MLNILNATLEVDAVQESHIPSIQRHDIEKTSTVYGCKFLHHKVVILLADFRKLKPLVKKPFGLYNDEANLQKENLSFPLIAGNLLE